MHVTEVHSNVRPYFKGVVDSIEAFRWDLDFDGWWLCQAMEYTMQLETDDSS